jgi:hypothetical protein
MAAGCSIAMLQMLEDGYRPARSEVLPRVVAVLGDREPAEFTDAIAPVDQTGATPDTGRQARHGAQ